MIVDESTYVVSDEATKTLFKTIVRSGLEIRKASQSLYDKFVELGILAFGCTYEDEKKNSRFMKILALNLSIQLSPSLIDSVFSKGFHGLPPNESLVSDFDLVSDDFKNVNAIGAWLKAKYPKATEQGLLELVEFFQAQRKKATKFLADLKENVLQNMGLEGVPATVASYSRKLSDKKLEDKKRKVEELNKSLAVDEEAEKAKLADAVKQSSSTAKEAKYGDFIDDEAPETMMNGEEDEVLENGTVVKRKFSSLVKRIIAMYPDFEATGEYFYLADGLLHAADHDFNTTVMEMFSSKGETSTITTGASVPVRRMSLRNSNV